MQNATADTRLSMTPASLCNIPNADKLTLLRKNKSTQTHCQVMTSLRSLQFGNRGDFIQKEEFYLILVYSGGSLYIPLRGIMLFCINLYFLTKTISRTVKLFYDMHLDDLYCNQWCRFDQSCKYDIIIIKSIFFQNKGKKVLTYQMQIPQQWFLCM